MPFSCIINRKSLWARACISSKYAFIEAQYAVDVKCPDRYEPAGVLTRYSTGGGFFDVLGHLTTTLRIGEYSRTVTFLVVSSSVDPNIGAILPLYMAPLHIAIPPIYILCY